MALYGRNVLVISNHMVGGQTELVVAIDIEESPETAAKPSEATSDFKRHFAQAQTQPKGQAQVAKTAAPAQSLPLVQRKAPQREDFASREMMDLIREELAALRREFQQTQQTPAWNHGQHMSPEVEELIASFTRAGMPGGLRTLLLDTVKDMRTEHEALLAVRNQLEQVSHRPSMDLPQTGMHVIAGPSGSGKTTMVVRLAREAAAQQAAAKVAIISYRDERVGAWAQTQALANQAGIECFRADSGAALSALLAQLGGRSLVLIDTCGTHMAERVMEIQAVCPTCSTHALVAADASTATLRRALRSSGVRWNSLMVSKLDESVQPWPLVEFLCDNFLPLSAASDGAQLGALRRDLSAASLVEMALAQLSRAPETIGPITAIAPIQVSKPLSVKLPPPSPRLFSPASPRGMRGPFN
jgi:flagellar biosynthesis GTPase FlhF